MTPFTPGIEGEFKGLPAAEYHSAPGVSQSTLKRFANAGSPLHYRTLPAPESSDAMDFGQLVHAAVLEPQTFESLYYVRPDVYPSPTGPKKWTNAANFCKEWNAAHSDRIIATQSEIDSVLKIREKLVNHPVVGPALEFGEKEVSYFKLNEETGLLTKCRCDIRAKDDTGIDIILDLKKCPVGEADKSSFAKKAFDFGYHMQAASYLAITGATRFIFVAFDDAEPCDIALHELDAQFLKLGLDEYNHQLKRFAKCHTANDWPGYGDKVTTLPLPTWGKRRESEIVDEQHAEWVKNVANARMVNEVTL